MTARAPWMVNMSYVNLAAACWICWLARTTYRTTRPEE